MEVSWNHLEEMRERSGRWRRNGLVGHISMLNECAGQFYWALYRKVRRQLKTEARMG